ncbi:MAG: UPF0262 family protein [Rhodospirillales bacterium]
MNAEKHRLIDIVLDEASVVRRSPQIEHERRVAIFDLLEENYFALTGGAKGAKGPADASGAGAGAPGPYKLRLAAADNRLIFDIRDEHGAALAAVTVPLAAFRRVVKDYFMVCESYFEAIKTAPPSRIEAIDMGRRGLHNEGAEQLRERLKDKIDIDKNTARGLFTLLCVLHIRA